ncbi:MAG: GNAT family N-acyltransferase [Paracoccaceae bacterium]
MLQNTPKFRTKIADDASEFRAAQELRYRVFIQELGGGGDMVDHELGLERDRFDPYFDHILLFDDARITNPIIGVYRVMSCEKANEVGEFYSDEEYDLTALRQSGKKLLELGRSCLEKDYRGGAALTYLWQAVANYVLERKIDILFGVASFHGTDVSELAEPLSLLHYQYISEEILRPVAKKPFNQKMNLLKPDEIDRKLAVLKMPALIKSYLRLGGKVGLDAYVDHQFNTTDVCLVMDTSVICNKKKSFFVQGELK